MSEDEDQVLLQQARQDLDELALQLDGRISARLRAARRHALAGGDRRHRWQRTPGWMPLGALASGVAMLAVAALVWLSLPSTQVSPLGMEDLELLAAQDSIDFYDELDFYYWLATIKDAG